MSTEPEQGDREALIEAFVGDAWLGHDEPLTAGDLGAIADAVLASAPWQHHAGEGWPCDNYRRPVTCLTAPSSVAGRCTHCRDQTDHAGALREALAEVGLPEGASLGDLIEHYRSDAALTAVIDRLADQIERDGDHAGTTVTAEQAWDEAAEATADWMSNNPSPSGIPHDPPSNPYRVPVQQDGGADS